MTGQDARACAGSPGAAAADATAVSDSLTAADAAAAAADAPQPVAAGPPPLDTSGITVGDVFFAWPSRDALASFAMMAALIALVCAVVCYLGAPPLTLGTAGAVVGAPTHPASALSQALCRVGMGTNQLGTIVLAASSETPVHFLAGACVVASVVQRFIDCEGWRVLLFACRVLLALASAMVRRAHRVLRASPRVARNLLVSCTILLVAFLVNTRLVVSVDGAPMATRVEMARAIVYSVPMAPETRQAVNQACVERHNVAFLGNFLDAGATTEIACDLGVADATSLALWDTGAALNASVGKLPVLRGSVRANTTYVSTANGLCRPPTRCTQLLPVRYRSGKRGELHLRDSVVLDSCQHTLCAGAKIAAEDGYGTMVAPYDGDTFVFSSFNDRTSDIPLTNLGVLIVPDARALPAFPISHGHVQNDATRTGENVHQTFNHRDHEILRHMPECTHAPESWSRALKCDCHDCLEANAKRVPVKGHVPDVQAPGDLMSMDGWETAVPHIHGGQRKVLGTYDAYSHLNRTYLMHSKSDAAACIESHMAWNNSLGIRYKRCHTDNAPDLCKGDAAATFRRWGVHVTTSAAWEPRQNGQMERRWRQHTEDSRVALNAANFTGTGAVASSNGEKYWWYAMRDAEMKSWSIPFKRDGVWTCPWLLHTGHRPNPTIHRPFGMLCYAKQYHPDSKTSARGRECRVLGYSLTQKAWMLLEVPSGKTFTSPHVHFCWGVFPGLRPYKAGGGADFSAPPPQPTPLSGPQTGAGMPDGTTQGPSPPPHQGPPPPPPRPLSPDPPSDEDSGDDGQGGNGDDDQGGDGGIIQGGNGANVPISQRLKRVSRRPYDPYTEQGGGSHPHPGSNRPSAPVSTAAASRGSTAFDVDSDLKFGDKYQAAVRALDPGDNLPPQSTKLEVPDGGKICALSLCWPRYRGGYDRLLP